MCGCSRKTPGRCRIFLCKQKAAYEVRISDWSSDVCSSELRAAVLTGAGPKAFVAGADIAEMSGLTPVQGRDFSQRGQRMMRRVEKMPKPVIAMRSEERPLGQKCGSTCRSRCAPHH